MPSGNNQDANTFFLRLEGPLQAWGDNSKFVIRRTMDAPTKSGVLGLICCAMHLSRQQARDMLPKLNELRMGVRIDRPGTLWQDYHTVGAGVGMMKANGEVKTGAQGTLITRRYYLCDASFFVALQAMPEFIGLLDEVHQALSRPRWPVYLGRKSCPPSLPVVHGDDRDLGKFGDLKTALASRPWRPRLKYDEQPDGVACLIEWRAVSEDDIAPDAAEVWYDAPFSFDPPVHHPRLVMRDQITVEVGAAIQERTPAPERARTDYDKSTWGKLSDRRRHKDAGLCVFCKSTASTVQHVNYRKAGKNDNRAALADPQLAEERMKNLRSLCRLCHDAVTMIEYGLGMGLDRIDPCDVRWHGDILRTRGEIVRFRSEEGRRRALRDVPEKLRREVLEEEDN